MNEIKLWAQCVFWDIRNIWETLWWGGIHKRYLIRFLFQEKPNLCHGSIHSPINPEPPPYPRKSSNFYIRPNTVSNPQPQIYLNNSPMSILVNFELCVFWFYKKKINILIFCCKMFAVHMLFYSRYAQFEIVSLWVGKLHSYHAF